MPNKKKEYNNIQCEGCGTIYKIRRENIKRFVKGLKYRCEICSKCLSKDFKKGKGQRL